MGYDVGLLAQAKEYTRQYVAEQIAALKLADYITGTYRSGEWLVHEWSKAYDTGDHEEGWYLSDGTWTEGRSIYKPFVDLYANVKAKYYTAWQLRATVYLPRVVYYKPFINATVISAASNAAADSDWDIKVEPSNVESTTVGEHYGEPLQYGNYTDVLTVIIRSDNHTFTSTSEMDVSLYVKGLLHPDAGLG